MRRIALTMLAGAVVLGACGLNPEGKTATPSPSPLPTGATNLRPGEAPLEPGTYGWRDFDPTITFEVAEGGQWYAVQLFDGFYDIQQDVGSPDVIAVQFARPVALYGAEGAREPEGAADAVALLEANPDLDVVETSDSSIGGLDGSQITVENTGEEPAVFVDLPPGTLAINGGRRLWIAFFDTDPGLLAIMVGGSIERWDEALTNAEPILESITIEQ